MRLLDVHSHILPGIDDGARNVEESLKLLTMLKEQGVTDVIATPHFSPSEENIEDYEERLALSKTALGEAVRDKDLPKIHYGCELLYSYGLGMMDGIKNFVIGKTDYVLLEFGAIYFGSTVCQDIYKIRDQWDVTPIIAHIERYKTFRGYDNLLQLVEKGVCLSQINASSACDGYYARTASKLIKKGLVTYVGSDAHSVKSRPPRIKEAYQSIAKKHGAEVAGHLIRNAEKLLAEIEQTE